MIEHLATQLSTLSQALGEKLEESNAQLTGFRTQRLKRQHVLLKLQELETLLMTHILCIQLGKGERLNVHQGCSDVSAIHLNFNYADVENAHRIVEDARDRMRQEIYIRIMKASSQTRSAASSQCDSFELVHDM